MRKGHWKRLDGYESVDRSLAIVVYRDRLDSKTKRQTDQRQRQLDLWATHVEAPAITWSRRLLDAWLVYLFNVIALMFTIIGEFKTRKGRSRWARMLMACKAMVMHSDLFLAMVDMSSPQKLTTIFRKRKKCRRIFLREFILGASCVNYFGYRCAVSDLFASFKDFYLFWQNVHVGTMFTHLQ